MVKPIGANRLLHVFGNELIECERCISRTFSELVLHSSYPSPSASLIHNEIRRILADSALVSLIFFPTAKPNSSALLRADWLRSELAVTEESLLRNRALRNHLAHLDERLDNWAMNSTNQTYGRGMLGSRADARRAGLVDEDILGLFDPKTFIFCFLSDDLRLDDLVGEIRTISHLAQRKMRDLPWARESH